MSTKEEGRLLICECELRCNCCSRRSGLIDLFRTGGAVLFAGDDDNVDIETGAGILIVIPLSEDGIVVIVEFVKVEIVLREFVDVGSMGA